MASQNAWNEECRNFARACRINIDVSRDVFWKVVIQHIPANELVSKIQAFLHPVQQFKPFHQQLKSLCQLGRDPTRTDFDISVLYSIARNVCRLPPPSAGWGNTPTLNATSCTDDLESLREARNTLYAHATDATMTKQVYDNFVTMLKAVLARFDFRLCSNFSQRLNPILTESLDPATCVLYQRYVDELLDQKKKEAKLKEIVRELEAVVNDVKDSVTKIQCSSKSDSDSFKKDIEELKGKQNEEVTRRQWMEEFVTKKVQTLNNDFEMHIEQIKKTQQTDTAKMQDLIIEMKVNEKSKDLTQKIDNLEKDNATLRNEIASLKLTCQKSEDRSKEALSKANHNEQYSRKNNIKIMDIPEKTDESDERLLHTVTEILHKCRININPAKVVAIHRIPGKDNHSRPVLVKFANNSEKSNVMKHRKGMKAKGHRLVDDVTRANVLLMQRLGKSSEIKHAWYYNGSVYGQTQSGKRHQFDIHDDIMKVLRKPFQSRN